MKRESFLFTFLSNTRFFWQELNRFMNLVSIKLFRLFKLVVMYVEHYVEYSRVLCGIYPTNSHLLIDTTLCACFVPCRGVSTFLPPIRPLLTLYPVMCPKTAPFSYHVAYPVLYCQETYPNMLGI